MKMQPDSKLSDSKKEKPYLLSRTEDVTRLMNRIKRKYAKAQMKLDPSEDGAFNDLGDSQILRAGLIRLNGSMDTSEKPEEIIAMVECAEKRRGPHTNTSETGNLEAPARTPSNGDATRASRRSA
ncbi:MAG: hypothetical protein DMF72_01325 [Acidobacteria bacterium]|nr:MAG: hypothetical protein DMF72_01325 [Acidobacteriota bacterium]